MSTQGVVWLFTLVFCGLAIMAARRSVPLAIALIIFTAGVFFGLSGLGGVCWALIDTVFHAIDGK